MYPLLLRIEKKLEGRQLLFFFLITTALYLIMIMITIPKVRLAAGGMEVLDMMPAGYTPDYVYRLLSRMGEEGRGIYLLRQIPLDLFYPGLFGITYCALLAWLLRRTNRFRSPWLALCALPPLAALFDYLENAGIILMIVKFPDRIDALAWATAFCSVVKAFASTVAMMAAVILFLKLLFQRKKSNA